MQSYAGTGAAEETGEDQGAGFSVNVPWEGPGVKDGDLLAAFRCEWPASGPVFVIDLANHKCQVLSGYAGIMWFAHTGMVHAGQCCS